MLPPLISINRPPGRHPTHFLPAANPWAFSQRSRRRFRKFPAHFRKTRPVIVTAM